LIETGQSAASKEIIAVFTPDGAYFDVDFADESGAFYDEDLLREAKDDLAGAVFSLGFADAARFSPSLFFLHRVASAFIDSLYKSPEIEFTRKAPPFESDVAVRLVGAAPYALGTEHIDRGWIESMTAKLALAFETELAEYDGSVNEYLGSKGAGHNVFGRVYFHLVESKDEAMPFAFMATYTTGDMKKRKANHLPLANAIKEFEGDQKSMLKLLSTVVAASASSEFIKTLLKSGELFSPIKLTSSEAYTFLKEVELYESCGVLCRIPDWWKKKRSSVKMSLSLGDEAPLKLGMEALIEVSPKLVFDGEELSPDEIRELLNGAEGLSMLKGRWVEADHEKLRRLLENYEAMSDIGDITFLEALRLEAGMIPNDFDGVGDIDLSEVTNGEWLAYALDRLRRPELHYGRSDDGKHSPGEVSGYTVGKDFKATLRPYQAIGFKWLSAMHSLGFGALLADDMGLGKTVQTLALIESRRLASKGKARTLLVIPASLIGNWRSEVKKFSPKLSCLIVSARDTEIEYDKADLFITTYGAARRNDALKEHAWDMIIVDEAQAIKNPSSKQTRAIKRINAKMRIALTGTPVENRLSDLWSIFDFLNRGLLGAEAEFKDYAARLKREGDYSDLRKLVSLFMLRRLKTDKSIISDLPEKIEVTDITTLSKKQIALYNAYITKLEKSLQEKDGIGRKGLVLASLMKLKQICNHPDQYLGQVEYREEQSGKFAKLREICETIYENRERVLIFTQFKEMTAPISDFLTSVFGRGGLVFHGGIPTKDRAGIVDKFNGDDYVPFMVLSLKAGGIGLNLTTANHVVHFDRWWNPAVENQATDRVYRIGQNKNVVVHKFVTENTLEERIDEMIHDKRKLAEDIVGTSGESWITELGNDDLLRLLRLSG
jgi:non-specific serine/threonine protein kinase